MVLAFGGWVLDEFNEEAQSDFSENVFVGSAVLGTKPSCRHFRHHDSKSVGAPAVGAPVVGAPVVGAPVVGAPVVGAPASCGRFAGILPASTTRSLSLPVLTPVIL